MKNPRFEIILIKNQNGVVARNYSTTFQDKGVEGMRYVFSCLACSPKLSSPWSVQTCIVSFHFRDRRAVKIAHQADKSFRWTWTQRHIMQTSVKLSVNVQFESLAFMKWSKMPWSNLCGFWLRGVIFVQASKRLNEKSPFWDYTN